jgi:hypothetical protein
MTVCAVHARCAVIATLPLLPPPPQKKKSRRKYNAKLENLARKIW